MSILSNCNPEHLREAIAGSLADDQLASLETHLESCENCRNGLQQLAANEHEWGKISDYFTVQDHLTDPFSGEATIDVQLNQLKHTSSDYELIGSSSETASNDESVLQPASHPEMLGRIGSFEIEQVIGRGGMGVVYKGYDTELNRPVAIKVLADHLAANGVARQRFAREARAAAAVMHPNVVPIHSVNSTGKHPYLVMTLVSGRSLQAHIEKSGPLGVKDIVRIAKQIAAGLSAAHREGLVHRDIKPANILLEKDVSRVMITDFGLARAADDAAITQTGWLAGTPHYMSPEQASGKEVDQRSDLFSLGSVMYYMATGREPFRADIPVAVLQKITTQAPAAVRSINSDTTKTLGNVIDRLMQKQPGNRFESAKEVESVLTQYLAHLEQPRTQPKPKIRNVQNSIRIKWALGIGIPLLLFATAACYIAWDNFTGVNTGNETSSAQSELVWPKGLQSPEGWMQEYEKLERDINQLESVNIQQPNYSGSSDPIRTERRELEESIERLENLIGNSP